MPVKLLIFIIFIGLTSCSPSRNWEEYKEKSDPCSSIELDKLAKLEPGISFYYIPKDIPQITIESLTEKIDITESKKEELKKEIYNSYPNSVWLSAHPDNFKSIYSELSSKSGDKNNVVILISEGGIDKDDSFKTLKGFDAVRELLGLEDSCANQAIQHIARIFNYNTNIPTKFKSIQPLMKIGFNKLYITHIISNESNEGIWTKIPIGFGFHYGPW